MADQPVTENEVAASFAAKLNSIDLTDEERSLLDATIFQAAGGSAEVQGFELWQDKKMEAAIPGLGTLWGRTKIEAQIKSEG